MTSNHIILIITILTFFIYANSKRNMAFIRFDNFSELK